MNNKVYNRDEIKENVMKYFNNDELSTEVWINKYSLKNQDGDIVEKSPIDMHVRMADEFARIEDKYKIEESKINLLSDYGQKREFLTKEKIFNYFDHFKYIIPQGSVMASLGNPYNISSLSNCIVISEIFDSYGGICFADQQLVQLMKRRCGVGLDLTTLRPKDMSVMNAAGTSTGAVSFMDRFSNTTREVAQSGRRGALMITMDVNHIDIEDFINSKQDLKKVTGANISIKLSDEFMQCVKSDIDYTLKFPINSENPKITKIINAKSLWNKIIKAAWNSAEPGLIFWDRHHKYSTSSIYPEYKNISTNPCAEISMGNDSCRLIALNMFSCVNEPFTKKSNFDFKKWYEISYEGQRLNDDLVDLELESIEKILKKIDSDVEPDHVKDVEKRTWKSLYEVGKNGRRTGLGFTALGDTIAALGYNYDSDESLDIVEKIIKTKCEAEFDSSIDMSIERGSFVEFDPEIENKSDTQA